MGLDLTGLGSAFDFAKGVMNRIWPEKASEQEKLAAAAAMAEMVESRDSERDGYRRDIMVAELEQGDKFTKRARPWLVYSGLIFTGLILLFRLAAKAIGIWVLLDKTADPVQMAALQVQIEGLAGLNLPGEFWLAWGGAVSIYSIGRSAEKRGAQGVIGTVAGMITGNKK